LVESLYEKVVIKTKHNRVDFDNTYRNLYIYNPDKVAGQIVINDDKYIDPSEIDLLENIPGGVSSISWSIPNPTSPIIVLLSNAFMKPHELIFKVEQAVPVDVQNSVLNVSISNSILDVNITNSLITIVPESAAEFRIFPKAGTVWDINVTNSVLDVNITNSYIDVNINNSVLNVSVENSVLVVDQLEGAVWDINVTNSTLNVNIQNSYLDVNITNSVINVTPDTGSVWTVNVQNSEIDVNVTNSVLAVNVQNSYFDVNITNSVINVTPDSGSVWAVNVQNSSLNVNVTNSTLDVNITNSYLDVNIQGVASVSITDAVITVGTAIEEYRARVPGVQAEYNHAVLISTDNTDIWDFPYITGIYNSGNFELINLPSSETIPSVYNYKVYLFSKPLIRPSSDPRYSIVLDEENTTQYNPDGSYYSVPSGEYGEDDFLTIDLGSSYTNYLLVKFWIDFTISGGADITVKLVLQTSEDNSSWSDAATLYSFTGNENSPRQTETIIKNVENISGRYLRFVYRVVNNASSEDNLLTSPYIKILKIVLIDKGV